MAVDVYADPSRGRERKVFTRSSIPAQKSADLALGHAARAHGLDQIVDRASRDTVDIGLLDHRYEGLLGRAARLRKLGK